MARALLGYVGPASEHLLALEIARLRRRVADLEAEVAELRRRSEAKIDMGMHGDIDGDLHEELHRIAKAAEPALA